MHTEEKSRLLTMWKERLDFDVILFSDIVKGCIGQNLTDEAARVVRHQLERLVIDVADDVRNGQRNAPN